MLEIHAVACKSKERPVNGAIKISDPRPEREQGNQVDDLPRSMCEQADAGMPSPIAFRR